MPPHMPVPDDPVATAKERTAFLRDAAPELLARLLGADPGYADLFYSATRRHALHLTRRAHLSRFRTPAPAPLRAYFDEGVGLRLLTRDGEAFASAAPDASALREAADTTAARAQSARLLPPPVPAPPVVPSPPAPEPVSAPAARTLLEAAVETALGADARVRSVVASYQDLERHTALVTSVAETPLPGLRVLVALRVEVTVADGDRRAQAYALGGGPTGFDHFLLHPAEATALEAVDRALRRLDAHPAPGGPVPVVFAPGWGGAWLHETIGHLLEADVLFGASAFLRDRLGEPIAPPGLALVDDGTVAGGRGTAPFDDEGAPAQRTVLIEDGRLCGVLTDRRHAALFDRPPSANGRRTDHRHVPLPRMTNLLLAPGSAAPDALLAEADGGLYVEQIGGGRLDPETGRFALRITDARRIASGRPAAPVAACVLTGEAATFLRQIRGIGDDFHLDATRGLCIKAGQPVPVSVGQPTVLVTGCSVAPAV